VCVLVTVMFDLHQTELRRKKKKKTIRVGMHVTFLQIYIDTKRRVKHWRWAHVDLQMHVWTLLNGVRYGIKALPRADSYSSTSTK
jgi:hypothetical protein